MAEQKSRLVLLGVFVTVVLALFGYLALKVGGVQTGNGVVVDAVFDDAQGLVENGNVRIAGIKVGSIHKLKVDGKRARVTLSIDPEVGARSDIVATIKAKSLLGEKFIELQPQEGSSAPMLKSGDVITNTYISAELPDLASQIAPLLSQIDPEDVARLVRVTSNLLEANEKDIPEVVDSIGRILVNVDGLLVTNRPRIDRMLAAADDAITNAGPKVDKLLTTTQTTLDSTNRLIEKHGPGIDNLMAQLAGLEVDRINNMLVELDTALQGSGGALTDGKEVISKVNDLLDGFEGLTWFDVSHLVRDEGINVRFMSRSDEDIEAARAQWGPRRDKLDEGEALTTVTPD